MKENPNEKIKRFKVCRDQDVINGRKYCFACLSSCSHCELVTEEEFNIEMEKRKLIKNNKE